MLTNWINLQSTDKTPDPQYLRLYSLYRLSAAAVLLASLTWQLFKHQTTSSVELLWTLVLFFIYALASAMRQFRRHTSQPNSVTRAQIMLDIVLTILMMQWLHAHQTGVGLLLILNIVFASLISDGRHAIFYAALATIGILLSNTYEVMTHTSPDKDYVNSVMLSLCCFATAWLAHNLALRMHSSETLATQRGLDIEQLAKTNDLITREMPNGVLVIDQHQLLRHYNAQASYLLGLENAVLDHAILHRTPIDTLIPALMQLLQSRQTPVSGNHDALRLNLNNRDLGIRFHAISEDVENGVVIFIEDWSQIQTQAHQVKLAALGRLTANIAHEIRNPLSAISHATQLLQEDAQQAGTVRMLQIISDNVQRVDQIIKDVLELNRRDRTNQDTLSINLFLQEFYQQFCAVEKINMRDFALNLPKENFNVLFDRRHINQILWNLCKNGWRHCKQQQESLKLALQQDKSGQFVHIWVTDDGNGIDPNILPHLFEPFMTTEKTGTGLGLYIARELAEANGAKLDYVSLPAGTQFSLTIKKAKA